MPQPQFDLRRFTFERQRSEPILASGDFNPEWRSHIERVFENFGSDFAFLKLPTKDGFYLFGQSIGETNKLAVWALDERIYSYLPDPFFWMREYPIYGDGRGLSEALELPQAIPTRNVEDVRAIFKNGDGPLLMGGAQALVDGAKIRLLRDKPDAKIIEQLWAFLPDSARQQISFSSFTSDEDAVQLMIVQATAEAKRPGFLTEDQCRDYPESPFEQQLQYSLDYRDQKLFDKLIARRSSRETLRLAVWMVLAAFVVLVIAKVLTIR